MEPAPQLTSLAMQSSSVIMTKTSLADGHCTGLVCLNRSSHFLSKLNHLLSQLFLLFPCFPVLFQPAHFHTACWSNRGRIFSRMLVSHGGLDVFYPVSSTI
ncbi:hypothetical protein KOW79_016293 [Hemibagrus wyckioides]|uniref:Uncharacterized protein n=1 Tax=Hemibagrus wyckioides TaxID=337641 RepID=A0A9D3NE25_9TELE|nr:hypothetical protein KOW79_016293 [Hemibagrus wyckioides]